MLRTHVVVADETTIAFYQLADGSQTQFHVVGTPRQRSLFRTKWSWHEIPGDEMFVPFGIETELDVSADTGHSVASVALWTVDAGM